MKKAYTRSPTRRKRARERVSEQKLKLTAAKLLPDMLAVVGGKRKPIVVWYTPCGQARVLGDPLTVRELDYCCRLIEQRLSSAARVHYAVILLTATECHTLNGLFSSANVFRLLNADPQDRLWALSRVNPHMMLAC